VTGATDVAQAIVAVWNILEQACAALTAEFHGRSIYALRFSAQ
jgi:hypothetical protein